MTDASAESMTLAGRVAPPMANGEVVFEAPWQGRLFGLARGLCDAGCFEWDEFRDHLIAAIKAWEASAPTEEYAYFDLFEAALTKLLAEKDLLSVELLEARTAEFLSRPHGHDHSH